MPGATALPGLHRILQASFGWSGEHLHRFTIHGRDFGIGDDLGAVALAGFGLCRGERLAYEYDLYDAWRHDIRVEEILAPVPGRLIRCVPAGRTRRPRGLRHPEAFLALRRQHSPYAVTARMAELLRRHRIDEFHRRAHNHALVAHDPGGHSS